MSGGFGIYKNSGGGGGSALTSIPIANTLYVAKNGSDATGAVADLSKPYLTIAAASADATAGETIYVYAGSYVETSEESFVDNVNYYLEAGVIVSNSAFPIVNDNSGVRNIRIFGEGMFLCGARDGVKMENVSSSPRARYLHLELHRMQITSGGSGINIEDLTEAYINITEVLNLGSTFFEVGGLTKTVLEFNSYTADSTAISSFETRISRVGGDESYCDIIGVNADIDFAAAGQGIHIQNGSGAVTSFRINNINNNNTDGLDFITLQSGGSTSVAATVTFRNARITSRGAAKGGIEIVDGSMSLQNVLLDTQLRAIKQRNGNLNLFNCGIFTAEGSCLELLGGETTITNAVLRNLEQTGVTGIIKIETGDLTLCNVQSFAFLSTNVFLYSVAAVNVRLQGTSVSNKVNSGTITNIITGTTFIADADVIIDSIF
tara:strand:- start:7865 stop:9166 length:1302 start_codon:yes stop_codon:yes gene_type:complete